MEPFARLERPKIPRNVLLAPLKVNERLEGVVGVARTDRAFESGKGRAFTRFTGLLAQELARRQEERLTQVLDRIKEKVRAEMRAGLVTLARAVAHDVNNAIGCILPLADQAREDLREGRVDPAELAKDLDVIMEKATLCKRIFANMLKAGSDRSADGVNQALELSRHGKFQVALIDVQLGDGDGYVLCQQVRALSPETDVILMTGSISEPDEKLYRNTRRCSMASSSPTGVAGISTPATHRPFGGRGQKGFESSRRREPS